MLIDFSVFQPPPPDILGTNWDEIIIRNLFDGLPTLWNDICIVFCGIFDYRPLAKGHNFQLMVEPASNLNSVTLESEDPSRWQLDLITRADESCENFRLQFFLKHQVLIVVLQNRKKDGEYGEW